MEMTYTYPELYKRSMFALKLKPGYVTMLVANENYHYLKVKHIHISMDSSNFLVTWSDFVVTGKWGYRNG